MASNVIRRRWTTTLVVGCAAIYASTIVVVLIGPSVDLSPTFQASLDEADRTNIVAIYVNYFLLVVIAGFIAGTLLGFVRAPFLGWKRTNLLMAAWGASALAAVGPWVVTQSMLQSVLLPGALTVGLWVVSRLALVVAILVVRRRNRSVVAEGAP